MHTLKNATPSSIVRTMTVEQMTRNSRLSRGACRWADSCADYRRRRPRTRFHPGAADPRAVCRTAAVPLGSASCIRPGLIAASASCAICCAAAHHPPLSSPPPPISTCHCTQSEEAHERGRNELAHESRLVVVCGGLRWEAHSRLDLITGRITHLSIDELVK